MPIVRVGTARFVLGTVCASMFTIIGGETVLLAKKECPAQGEVCWPVREDLARYVPGGTMANTITVSGSSSS